MDKKSAFRWLAAAVALFSSSAFAIEFNFNAPWGDEKVEGVLNTSIVLGAEMRAGSRSVDLVGKADNNPNVCGRFPNGKPQYQSCQGLFRDQSFLAAHLAASPGQANMNADDGNLNYGKGKLTQAPLEVTQDINLKYGDFGFFAKWLFFYDFINNDFTEYHPNRITRDNYLQVGSVSNLNTDSVPRTDSTPCPANRNPSGGPCGIVYGSGGIVNVKRSDGETLRQVGTNLLLLDSFFYGKFRIPGTERDGTFKIGRQILNWGESTYLVFGSINQANPINANTFFRMRTTAEEIFTPVGMVYASFSPKDNWTAEAFYQLEWKPLEAPGYGSYYSFADLGSHNGGNKSFTNSFGVSADDPDQKGRLLDNALSGLTNTTAWIERLPDNEPNPFNQFGFALKYYAEWLNNGTNIGLYFMNYHSRIPMVSTYAVPQSCAKQTSTTAEFVAACSDIPLLHQPANDPAGATSTAVNFDDIKVQLEYPENIQLYGLSFNTTAGDFSFQGEVAYRPRDPLQVAIPDLVFAAYGPTASNCHLHPCGFAGQGSTTGEGLYPDGTTGTYAPSDYMNAQGQNCHTNPAMPCDTYDLLAGHMVGSARAFPSFIIPYRGMTIGTNPSCNAAVDRPNKAVAAIPGSGYYTNNPGAFGPGVPCYIRGWEYQQTFEFTFGGTMVSGETDMLSIMLGANQVITLFEAGATWVPNMPDVSELQFESPGNYYHASAGADGTGADGSRQACSTNPTCNVGPDGTRFNPHQQDLSQYPDKISYGYDIIWLVRYESILPGISLAPLVLWKQDVQGTAPGIAANFVQGRKLVAFNMETRYKSNLSFTLGRTFLWGGGPNNLLRDRDAYRATVKYQF